MKKILSLLIAAAALFSLLTACSTPPPVQPDTQTAGSTETATTDISIRAADCFNSMYCGFVTEKSGIYCFSAKESGDNLWSVYVFDEEFPDALRYISQAAEPILEGDGEIAIEVGKHVYVYYPINGFTSDAPDENAYLEVTIS